MSKKTKNTKGTKGSKSILALLDKNGDGKVSQSEFRQGLTSKELEDRAFSKGISPISLLQLRVGNLHLKPDKPKKKKKKKKKPRSLARSQVSIVRRSIKAHHRDKHMFDPQFKN